MSLYIQFSNAKNLQKLEEELLPYLTINEEEFRQTYFDIETCDKNGLDNWGIILNISRTVLIGNASDGVFGFGQQSMYPVPPDGYPQNFNNGFFYNLKYEKEAGIPYELNDFQYRTMLQFRYRTITCNMSLFSINKIMNQLVGTLSKAYGFENHRCRVKMTGYMKLSYEFNFALLPWMRAIFINRNVLPVPAGVFATILENRNF